MDVDSWKSACFALLPPPVRAVDEIRVSIVLVATNKQMASVFMLTSNFWVVLDTTASASPVTLSPQEQMLMEPKFVERDENVLSCCQVRPMFRLTVCPLFSLSQLLTSIVLLQTYLLQLRTVLEFRPGMDELELDIA